MKAMNSMKQSSVFNRAGRLVAAVGTVAAMWALNTASLAAQPPSKASTTADKAADKNAPKDKIIFRSGKEASGIILSETDTTVRMRVVGAGGISAEMTYDKGEILTIERAAKTDPAPDSKKPADSKAAPAAADASKKPDAAKGKEGAAKIYIVELKGDFGRDVSKTPLRDIMMDARKFQPDILLVKMDTDFKLRGEEAEAFAPGGAEGAFDQQLETARQVQTILTDEVRDDPEWKTKPRMVCWVKKALGGAAFLPFIFPEIYFTSDGMHGGVGYLDHLFDGVGDFVVQRKQQSLRLGRAEGLANKGGHDPLILRAMAMSEMILTVKYEGGKPVFLERRPEAPDEELLTDEGLEENGTRDTLQDVVRLKGNDNLNLTADLAYKLGLSEGTADTQDDLIYKLGVSRNYTVVEGKGKDILSDWSRNVENAEKAFRRKFVEQRDMQVDQPGDYPARTKYRGTRIRLLTECRSLLEQYKEAVDPRRVGPPDQMITQINLTIEQLKTQQRLDTRR